MLKSTKNNVEIGLETLLSYRSHYNFSDWPKEVNCILMESRFLKFVFQYVYEKSMKITLAVNFWFTNNYSQDAKTIRYCGHWQRRPERLFLPFDTHMHTGSVWLLYVMAPSWMAFQLNINIFHKILVKTFGVLVLH